jgi:hypothetical protein
MGQLGGVAELLARDQKLDVYTLRRITGRDRGQDWGDL